MSDRYFQQLRGSLDREVVKLFGSVTFTTSGAIASQDCLGFSVAKTGSEAGRYTVTLEDQYNRFMGVSTCLEEAADAAITATEGFIQNIVRNVAMTSKTFDIQLVQVSAADAEPASGNVLHIEITLGRTARS